MLKGLCKMETPKSQCKNCGKMTDISESKTYVQMKIKCQVTVEELKDSNSLRKKLRIHRAAEMNAMHIMIKRLYEIMTLEQRKEAFELGQSLRDEFRHIQKIPMKR